MTIRSIVSSSQGMMTYPKRKDRVDEGPFLLCMVLGYLEHKIPFCVHVTSNVSSACQKKRMLCSIRFALVSLRHGRSVIIVVASFAERINERISYVVSFNESVL